MSSLTENTTTRRQVRATYIVGVIREVETEPGALPIREVLAHSFVVCVPGGSLALECSHVQLLAPDSEPHPPHSVELMPGHTTMLGLPARCRRLSRSRSRSRSHSRVGGVQPVGGLQLVGVRRHVGHILRRRQRRRRELSVLSARAQVDTGPQVLVEPRPISRHKALREVGAGGCGCAWAPV